MRTIQFQVGTGTLAFFAFTVAGFSVCLAQDDPCCEKCASNLTAAKLVSHETENEKQTISFQLRDWKQMHFDDAQAAEKHLKTVEQLGCVAKKSQHGGHIDVRYHCQEWKSIFLDNAAGAQQWHDWLVSAGFDVFRPRMDNVFSIGAEAVQFRLLEFKSMHGDGSPEQNQFIETLKKVGCDVRVMEHNGHSDIRFRAPIWCTIRVADEAAAIQWREWFTAQGFEAKVVKEN